MSSSPPPQFVTNPIPPTVIGAYENAWRALRRGFWPIVGAVLLTVVAQLPGNAINIVGTVLDRSVHGAAIAGLVLTYAWMFLVMMPLQYGAFRLMAAAARSEALDFSDVLWAFKSPSSYVRSVGGMLALCAAIMAAMLPAVLVLLAFGCGAGLAAARHAGGNPSAELTALLGALGVAAILVALIAMLPGMWIALRLVLAQFLVPDAEMGPIDAITTSWAMTRGHGLTILGIVLAFVPLVIAGCMAFCVGYFVAMALAWLALASLYAALGGRRGVPPGIA
jgi:uncharacterized membrane protein